MARAATATAVVLLACVLLATAAHASTDSFGPALPVPIHESYALSGHNTPESEWLAFGAFEQEGRPRAAPISGTLSQVRLEYGSILGMEVQIWTANAATGALVQRVDTLELEPTGACGDEKTKIESLSPNTSINAGEVLVLLNSDEKGGYICAYPEGVFDGYLGRFGEAFTPETGRAPSKWSLQNGLGIALEGTVTTESGKGSTGTGGGSPSGGSTGPSSHVTTVCGSEMTCTISIEGVEYKVTINPGNKAVYTKQPGAYQLPIGCEVHGLDLCEGTTYSYCVCSPFGQVSRAHAPRQTVLGRGSFKIPSGDTRKVKVKLTSAGRAILRQKHVLHATVVTTMKLPGGQTASIKGKLTVSLRR